MGFPAIYAPASVTYIMQGAEAEEDIDLETLQWSGRCPERYEVLFSTATPPAYRKFICLSSWCVDPSTGVYIPPLWSWHPYHVAAIQGGWADYSSTIFASSRKATVADDAGLRWIVEVWYSSVANPLNLEPVVNIDFTDETVEMDTDAEGNAILNAANEPFDPPMQKVVHDLVLRFSQVNLTPAEFDDVKASSYVGCVNAGSFLMFPEGTVKLRSCPGQLRRVGDIYFVEWSFEFVIRTAYSDPLRLGWVRRVLNQGFRNIDGKTFVDTVVKDGEEQETVIMPRTEPTLLDEDGYELADDADPDWLTFDDAPRMDFGTLPQRVRQFPGGVWTT